VREKKEKKELRAPSRRPTGAELETSVKGLGSELEEAELPVGTEQGVVPVHHPVAPRDLPDPGVDELRDVLEGATRRESGRRPSKG
jgi:hypothetical protein